MISRLVRPSAVRRHQRSADGTACGRSRLDRARRWPVGGRHDCGGAGQWSSRMRPGSDRHHRASRRRRPSESGRDYRRRGSTARPQCGRRLRSPPGGWATFRSCVARGGGRASRFPRRGRSSGGRAPEGCAWRTLWACRGGPVEVRRSAPAARVGGADARAVSRATGRRGRRHARDRRVIMGRGEGGPRIEAHGPAARKEAMACVSALPIDRRRPYRRRRPGARIQPG